MAAVGVLTAKLPCVKVTLPFQLCELEKRSRSLIFEIDLGIQAVHYSGKMASLGASMLNATVH